MKRNEGITLIALIITIVILIILTAVTINNVINTNLFGLAKGAVVNYIQAGKEEENVINEIMSASGEIGKVDSSDPTESKPAEKKKPEIGDLVAYDPTVSDKAGTKITEGLTYTSNKGTDTDTTGGNGYKDAQIFAVNDNNLQWVILDITGNTVTLVSKDVVKTDADGDFEINGAIGYLYAEQELHKICSIYGHGYGADTGITTTYKIGGPVDEQTKTLTGSGARSITIEDLNKLAGIGNTYDDYKKLNSSYGSSNYQPTLCPIMNSSSGNRCFKRNDE